MTLIFKKRVREINCKYSSLSGQISSRKINDTVQFESSLERDFIYLLEFDTQVKRYLEQPIEIFYKDSFGVYRKYIPDFIITYHDKFRKDEVVEIKYIKDLRENKDKLDLKFKAAREFCKKNNLLFKICTDKDIRDDNALFLNNIKFLGRYRDYFDKIDYKATGLVFDTSYAVMLMNKASESRDSTINSLISTITKDKNKRAELIFLMWYLVANNFISCDLRRRLSLDSKIWID